MGYLRKIRQDIAKKPVKATKTDTVTTRSMKQLSTSSITASVGNKNNKKVKPSWSKTVESISVATVSKQNPYVTTNHLAKVKPAVTSETHAVDTGGLQQQRVQQLQDRVKTLENEIVNLKTKNSEMSGKIIASQDAQASLDELNGLVNELEIENADLKEEITILQDTLRNNDVAEANTGVSSDLYKEIAEVYSKVHQMEQDAQDHDKVMSDYQRQVFVLKKELKIYQEKISTLEREATGKGVSEDVQVLRKMLQEVEEERKLKEEDCIEFVAEIDELNDKLDEINRQVCMNVSVLLCTVSVYIFVYHTV